MNEERNFLEACRALDVDKAKEYLAKGMDVNVKVEGNFALKCVVDKIRIGSNWYQSRIHLYH